MADGKLFLPEQTPISVVTKQLVTTEFVHPDEPCYIMTELEGGSLSGEKRRFRMFVVNRNDQFAYFWQDLGPATGRDGFQIWALYEESVGQCISLSEYMHGHPEHWDGVRDEAKGHSADLIPRFFEQMEQAHKQLRKQSHHGPTLSVER